MIWRELWCFEGWASRRRPPAFQIYSAVLSLFTRIVHSRKSTALSIDCAVSRRFPFLLGYYNGLLFVAYFERAFKVFPFVVSSGRRRLFCSRLTPMMSFTICVRVEIRVFRWSVEILRRVADWLFRLLAAWPPYTTVGTTMTTRTTKSWPSCWTQLWKEISEFFRLICFLFFLIDSLLLTIQLFLIDFRSPNQPEATSDTLLNEQACELSGEILRQIKSEVSSYEASSPSTSGDSVIVPFKHSPPEYLDYDLPQPKISGGVTQAPTECKVCG